MSCNGTTTRLLTHSCLTVVGGRKKENDLTEFVSLSHSAEQRSERKDN